MSYNKYVITLFLIITISATGGFGTAQNPDYKPSSDIQAILNKYKNIKSDGSNAVEVLTQQRNPNPSNRNTSVTQNHNMTSNIRENRFTSKIDFPSRQNTDRNTQFTKQHSNNISFQPSQRQTLYADSISNDDLTFKPSNEYLENYYKVYLEKGDNQIDQAEKKRRMQIEIDADNQRQANLEEMKRKYKENRDTLEGGYKAMHMKGFDQRNGITDEINLNLEKRLKKRLETDPNFMKNAGNFKDPHGIYEEFRNQDPKIKDNALARKFFII